MNLLNQTKQKELIVFIVRKDAKCDECGAERADAREAVNATVYEILSEWEGRPLEIHGKK